MIFNKKYQEKGEKRDNEEETTKLYIWHNFGPVAVS